MYDRAWLVARFIFAALAADLTFGNGTSVLPDGPLIVGYQNWGACNLTETIAVAERGVNVIIWFSIRLAKDGDGRPSVESGPNYTCVAEVRAALEVLNLPTAHLISVGGWDAPHPDTSFTGNEWFAAWNAWNKALPHPFDGLDWDLEGSDNVSAPSNEFTPAVLELMISMSTKLKAANYVVSLVPAQSYFDVSTRLFNRSLLNAYPDYHPDFHNHGLNCYAYVLAAAPVGTFDFVTVQLYESWSRADQALQAGIKPSVYLQQWVAAILAGWEVDFNDPSLRFQGQRKVQLAASQLIIGFAYSDSTKGKSAAFLPTSAQEAYLQAKTEERPRGYAFWMISDDYKGGPFNGTEQRVPLSSGLNEFLHIRNQSTTAPLERSRRLRGGSPGASIIV